MKSGFAVRLALSGALLAFLFTQMDHRILINWWSSRHAPDLAIFMLSTILVLAQIFFLNLRWHAYLNAAGNKIAFSTSVLTNIAGYFANILFINAVGGIIAKSGLAVRHGVSLMHALIATFLDRFMTLFALIVFSALGLPFLLNAIDSKILTILSLTVLGFAACTGLPLLALRLGVLDDFILSSRRRSRLMVGLRSFARNREMMLETTLYSLVAQALFILSVYVLSWGIQTPHENTAEFLALLPILALISSLPIGFGGWGIRESAFVYGLGLIGYGIEESFMLSIQVGLVGLVAPFIYGLPYIARNDFKEFLAGSKARNCT